MTCFSCTLCSLDPSFNITRGVNEGRGHFKACTRELVNFGVEPAATPEQEKPAAPTQLPPGKMDSLKQLCMQNPKLLEIYFQQRIADNPEYLNLATLLRLAELKAKLPAHPHPDTHSHT